MMLWRFHDVMEVPWCYGSSMMLWRFHDVMEVP